MLDLTTHDKNLIEKRYQSFLHNLKSFLDSNVSKDALIYAKAIITMLHNGYFSTDRKITFSNDYHYLALPSIPSDGVYVSHGICCCRHATSLLQDSLNILSINPKPLYIHIDDKGAWKQVTPPINRANHVVLLLEKEGKEYLIDAANNFILQKMNDGSLIPIDVKNAEELPEYQDPNMEEIGHTLKKYYIYRDLGVDCVYDS